MRTPFDNNPYHDELERISLVNVRWMVRGQGQLTLSSIRLSQNWLSHHVTANHGENRLFNNYSPLEYRKKLFSLSNP